MRVLGGAAYPWRGLRFLLAHRELWKHALLPFAINALLVGVAAAVLVLRFDDLAGWATSFLDLSRPGSWQGWPLYVLGWLLKAVISVLVAVAAAVLLLLLFLVLAGILASPFNEVLSERVERLAGGEPRAEEPFSAWRAVREGGHAVAEEVRKALFFLGLFLVLLPLHLVPVAGSAAHAAASGALAMLFLALEFLDYPLARRGLRFRDKRAFLRRHRGPALGFGAVMLGALAVPIVNLALLPVGAVAGTLLYLDLARVDREALL